MGQKGKPEFVDLVVENLTFEEMGKFISDNKVNSPEGNELSQPKKFNQLFKTEIGVVEDAIYRLPAW